MPQSLSLYRTCTVLIHLIVVVALYLKIYSKINYSELNGLRLTVQSARLAILSKFTDFEKTVSAFSEETNLSGSSWESAKAYITQFSPVSQGIFDVLSVFGEQLNAYLDAFKSEVGSSKNRLDSDHLFELNTDKMTEMMKKAGLGELGVFVLQVTGVNNFRRYFNGVDPITGEKLTSNEKSLYGVHVPIKGR